MTSLEKTAKKEKPQTEIQKRFHTHPLMFVGTVLVLVIVIVAFVLVPAIVPEAGTGLDTTFGYYGKAPISYASGNFFYRVQQDYGRRYSGISGIGFERYLWRQAFDAAAVRAAMIEEARLSGYTPPDEVVDRAVAGLPEFQENGRFSAVRYRALDGAERMRYWQNVKDDLTVNRYLADVSGLLVSEEETAFIANMAEERRTFDIAAFPINQYPAEEIAAYITAHEDLFQTVHLSQITITSGERDAQKVLDQVKSGAAAFEDAARSQSADSNADRGGDMGAKPAFELAAEIPDETERRAVLALPPGTISEVVKVPAGWAFFRAEEPARGADPAETTLIDKARSYLLSFERGIVEDYYLARAEAFNEAVRADGFDNACEDANITKTTIGPLPVNYGDTALFATVGSYAVSALSDAPTNENFWKTAFSAPVGTPSRPIVLGDNVLVLFPAEEAAPDDDTRQAIENYYTGTALNEYRNERISETLLTSKKFKDRFDTVFSKLFQEG
jgi:hypothetical protein